MNTASIFNRIWLASQWGEHKKFLKACRAVEATQALKLKHYLSRNAATSFGKGHGFEGIHSYEQFANKVPIQSWEDIQPWIDRMVSGEGKVLFEEDLIAFEETSGTTSMAKWVPYNASLKKEFQTGVAAWICSMYQSQPKAFAGPSYWSLSPATREKRSTPKGIPIGMESDGDYFDPLTKFFLNRIWAVSPEIARESHPESFYLKTLQQLLLKDHLALISIWSPTFLIQLDDFLKRNLSPIIEWLSNSQEGNKERREFLIEELQKDFSWASLFPHLQLLSCWTDAQAELSLPTLRSRLGPIPIQGKGLLSTEGISSIPIHPDSEPVLSLRSHFYEFRSVDTGKVFLAHQLKVGEVYEVILTTGGGLYRYASGDLLRVMGHYHANPSFKFLGRGSRRSDLVGEKLSDDQVLTALKNLPKEILAKLSGLFVCGFVGQTKAFYRMYLSPFIAPLQTGQMKRIKNEMEEALRQNPYYAQAIRLGQLAPLQVVELPIASFIQLKEGLKKKRQIKDGDFKMPVLFKEEELTGLVENLVRP